MMEGHASALSHLHSFSLLASRFPQGHAPSFAAPLFTRAGAAPATAACHA
jgi:hypothetical protein